MPTANAIKKMAAQDTANGKEEPTSNTLEGKVVSITGDKLVTASKSGKIYSHTLAKDVKLTRDNTACKPEDLKAGSAIRVTTKKDDRNVATSIELLNKNCQAAQSCG